MKSGEIMPVLMILLMVVMVVVVGFIVFVERGQRRIQVQYARRVVGRKMYGGQTTFLPFEGEHLRGYSPDLRLVAVDVSGHGGELRPQ